MRRSHQIDIMTTAPLERNHHARQIVMRGMVAVTRWLISQFWQKQHNKLQFEKKIVPEPPAPTSGRSREMRAERGDFKASGGRAKPGLSFQPVDPHLRDRAATSQNLQSSFSTWPDVLAFRIQIGWFEPGIVVSMFMDSCSVNGGIAPG